MAGSFSVDGLISGINTTQMIDQLLSLERRPLLTLEQKQLTIQRKAQALVEVKTKIAALQASIYNLTLNSYVNGKTATTNTPSTSAAILTATADSSAANGTFAVTVSRLATATKVSSATAIGQAVTATATLATGGFAVTPTTGTFSIRGTSLASFTIDSETVLSDGVDAAGSNTIIAKINNAGIGVTASLVNDADGRPNLLQLVSSAGVSLQVGAGADSSNFLTAAKLLDAQVVGNSAATVTGAALSAGAIASTAITINGVTTTTTATGAGNTAAENASSIAADINNTADSTVTAVGNGDGTITLTQKTSGASYTIDITEAGTGTGLTVAETDNGTDRITSLSNLGTAKTGEALANSRLSTPIAGLDGNGNGEFKVNGVSVTFSETESINTIISRINASDAGVVASYDSLLDKIRLTAIGTGAAEMSLEDVTGNFLAATGVLNATQTLGQNALYSIDSVMNGQQLSSASNTISGIIPGVTLTLKSTSSSPVTVTVSQDTAKTVEAVTDFINKYNSAIGLIRQLTAYNPDTKQAGVLLGDSSVRLIESSLRSMANSAAYGLTGSYLSLADIGITTGSVGSGVGTTISLQLDQSKLTEALVDNPSAVAAVFNSFRSTATLSGAAGSILSITGTPTAHHEPGTYTITTTTEASNNITVQFTRSNGTTDEAVTSTITAGGTNSTLIPGVTLTVKGTLEAGQQTIAVSVLSKGVAISINDYLKSLTAATGLFAERAESSDEQLQRIQEQMARVEQRVEDKRARLVAKFSQMEVALSRLQAQSNALASQLAQWANMKYGV